MADRYVRMDDWSMYWSVDDDGHLTIELLHADGSEVVEVDEDLDDGTGHLMRRFTTEKIEDAYRESLVEVGA